MRQTDANETSTLWGRPLVLMCVAAVAWMAGVGPAAAQSGGDSKLRQAYEKEFAHLEAQKRALEERLGEAKSRGEQRIAEAKAERDRLQGKLTAMKREADRLQEKLDAVERAGASAARGSDIVASTVRQGNATLEERGLGVDVPTKDRSGGATKAKDGQKKPAKDYRAALEPLFERGARAIRRSRSLQVREDGQFFLADGTQVDGTVVELGDVAAWGVSDEAAGALAPAGEGRLKIWNATSAETAKALAAGEWPETLQTYLFESLDKGARKDEAESWLDTVNAGGVVAWVIVGLGALGLLLALLRTLLLGWIGRGASSLADEVGKLAADGRLQAAKQRCENASGAASRVLEAAVDNLEEGREVIEDTVTEAMLREEPAIQRFGSAILVFAAVAPLLGLLGTVTGMISTFDIITKHGTGDPRMLSGGISEALITTQLGLIVAIPLLLVGNLLKGWGQRILGQLERSALRVVNLAQLYLNAKVGSEGISPEAGASPEARDTDGAPSGEGPGDPGDVESYLGAV